MANPNIELFTSIAHAMGALRAQVLFEGSAGETIRKKLWMYDLRTNKHFTLKTNSLTRTDLDEFVDLYQVGNCHQRHATWTTENPDGR